jgi:peptidoglycan/LPS O-acetylase OafA/YrhL
VFPTYFVGLSVTVLAIFFSTKYFASEWPYTLKEVLIQYIPGIRDILWSRNIDGIIWTLEIEVKFYLLCALLIGLFRRYSLWVFLAPVVLVMIATYLNHLIPVWLNNNLRAYELAMVYGTVSQFILFMFIGVMFHYIYQKKIGLRKGYICIGGLFILFCLDWFIGPSSITFRLVWNYAFALLTFVFAYTFPSLFRANRVTNFLADISYPLYVIHGVAGYVVLRVMLDRGVKAWVALCVVTGAAFLLAWLIHITIERPCRVFGKKIGTQLTPVPKVFALSPLNEGLS